MGRWAIATIALALAGCGSRGDDADKAAIPAGIEIADNGMVVSDPGNAVGPTEPDATGAGTAFGLTADELEDAVLVDAAGAPLGEVTGVSTDVQGEVNALVVQVASGNDMREVRVPLSGLSRAAAGDHWNIRSQTLTRADLLATARKR